MGEKPTGICPTCGKPYDVGYAMSDHIVFTHQKGGGGHTFENKNLLVVGSKVSLKRGMLGEPAGAIGFVVDVYRIGNARGVSIIFENGGFDGFSPDEQYLYLNNLGVDERYANYLFNNVWEVERNRRDRFWEFK